MLSAADLADCLQLADDFTTFVEARLNRGSRTQSKDDELNLVYVALTRAMLGLVCNRDLAELVTAEASKQMVVEVSEQGRLKRRDRMNQ